MKKNIAAVLFFAVCAAQTTQAGPSLATDDGKYSIKFEAQLQPQFQWLSVEGAGKSDSFQIRRGRMIFKGHAWKEGLTYKFQFEAVAGRTSNASPGVAFGGPNLRDAYVNYDFGNGIEIQVGQFKPYYNREELTGSSHLQFVDRGLTNEVFSFNRDLGLAIHGDGMDDLLEYALYVANEGTNRNIANHNQMMLIGGRFVFNFLGKHGYTLSDVDHSQEPHLAAAVAANYNRVGAANNDLTAVLGDVAYRYQGFSFLGEGHYLNNATGVQTHTFGLLGQTGYFFVPKHFEVAGRFAAVIPTAAGVVNGYEGGVCFNYFFDGHKVKLQTDYNMLINSALVMGAGGVAGTNAPANIVTAAGAPGFLQNRNDHRIRMQLQLYL